MSTALDLRLRSNLGQTGHLDSSLDFAAGTRMSRVPMFAGPPRILRMHGRGIVHERNSDGYQLLHQAFDDMAGARPVIEIEIEIERLSTSCGYSVPFLDFNEERPTLVQWASRKSPEELEAYRAEKNATSINGLPIF